MTYGLIIGSVALVTATAYWQSRYGYLAIGVIGGAVGVALLAVVTLPERAWERIAGIDTLANDLGQLHAEGAVIRHKMPWEPDSASTGLDAWTVGLDAWDRRVQERLANTPWLGTYLSPVTGIGTSVLGFSKASKYGNALDARLERLGQIIAAIGGRK